MLLVAAGAAALLAWFFVPSPPPTVKTGTITVVVKQPDGRPFSDGAILVDGQAAGSSGTTITVPAGTVTIGVAAQGWTADPQRVEIRTGVASRAELTVRALLARVTVASDPAGALISIDGRVLGWSPIRADVPAGQHVFMASLDGYGSNSTTLSIAGGEERTVKFDLPPTKPAASGLEPLRTQRSPDSSAPNGNPAFVAGVADRQNYEAWFATLDAETQGGAAYWAENRSRAATGVYVTCSPASASRLWTQGCLAAKKNF